MNTLAVSSGEGEDFNLLGSLAPSQEISDVYLTPMSEGLSDDSEGEENPSFNVNGKYLFIWSQLEVLLLLTYFTLILLVVI